MIEKTISIDPLVVDIKTASKRLGVCERTIRSLTQKGVLPSVQIPGLKRVFYSCEDLNEFVRHWSKRRYRECKE